jgi:hypothetical protein
VAQENPVVMAHDVFIANSHHDGTEAVAVRRLLEARGFRCWIWSRDIVKGIDFGRQIEEAIEAAKAVVVISSRAAAASPHVCRDIGLALLALETRGAFVIMFSIERIPDPWQGTRGITPARINRSLPLCATFWRAGHPIF